MNQESPGDGTEFRFIRVLCRPYGARIISNVTLPRAYALG